MKKSNLSQRILNTLGVKTSQQKKDEQLFNAIEKANYKAGMDAINNGANVNFRHGGVAWSPLQRIIEVAVRSSNQQFNNLINLARELLSRESDINYVNKKGETALSIAVIGGNQKLVEFLLNEGADVDIRKNKTTSIDIKISENTSEQDKPRHEKMFSEYRDRENKVWSPIHIAVQSGNTNIVQLLLNHGADPTVKDKFGRTAFDIAEEKGDKEIKKLLSEHVVNSKFYNQKVSKVEKGIGIHN